jgi:hypothetical protein
METLMKSIKILKIHTSNLRLEGHELCELWKIYYTEKEQDHKLSTLTFPSYSCFSSTSGAIYAGVPTVDFGCEWSTEDCQ